MKTNEIILEPFNGYEDFYYLRVICGEFDNVIAILNLRRNISTQIRIFSKMTEAELWAEFHSILGVEKYEN